MGGVCSVRRHGDRSPQSLGEGGAPPSYFDVAWDEEEDEGYAPIAGFDTTGGGFDTTGGGGAGGSDRARGGGVGDGGSGSSGAAPAAAAVDGIEGEGSTAVGGVAGDSGSGGGGVFVPRWPALAEEHLSRLYSNDDGTRACSNGGGGSEPLSLMELCVRSICRRLGDFRKFPSYLPREVVDALLGSLTQHRALSSYALRAFRDCEVTSLALGECRGVRNGWVRELLQATPCGRCIVTLDLSSCTGLTDTGLSDLPALKSLESASLRRCSGLGAEATLCLSNSPGLETLSLAHCPLLNDAAVGNLAGLSRLRSLELEGCENISDEGLRLACRLPSLTCLNASRCHGLTVEGLAGLEQAADGLKRLNLGWCAGLVGGLAAGVGGGEEESDEDDEDDGGGGDSDDEALGEGTRGRRRRGRWVLPVLPKLERVCLARSGIGNEGLSRLSAGSPLLRDLDLCGCVRLTENGAHTLSALQDLETLDLSNCRRVRGVAAGLGLSVSSLSVAETSVGDAEVEELAQKLPGLTALNLDRCTVGDTGVRALSSLTKLERLNLADTSITDAGMSHLAPLTRLKDLNLFFCHITDAGLGPLAALSSLVRLNLDTRDVGDAGMVQLTRLRLLESLDVFSASITDFGVAHGLCRLPCLTTLEVCSGRLTDRGLYHLSRVKSLTRLNVSQNLGITAVGVRHVGTLTRLRSLNLSSCNITPSSLDSLTGLVNLESLSVFGCRLEMTDLELLREKLPNLRVVRAA